MINQSVDDSSADTQVIPSASPEPAMVIEPYDEQPSQWKPILPHELGAHIEEMEILLNLMQYSRRITSMTQDDLDVDLRNLTQLSEQELVVTQKLQLALLYSLSTSRDYDTNKAKEILTSVIDGDKQRAPVLREYAYTLMVNIKQTEEAERQNALLRKKLKQEISRRQKLVETQKQLEQTRTQLEQKLEALRSIEESITQRQNEPQEIKP